MHICHNCGGKTYEVVKSGDDKARKYEFWGYRGRVICSKCIKEGGYDSSWTTKGVSEGTKGLTEETYINPS